MFRTPEEELKELVKELRELKNLLRDISSKVASIEKRAKRAFPDAFTQDLPDSATTAPDIKDSSILSAEEAQKLYDDLVRLAKQDKIEEVRSHLEAMAHPNLNVLYRELGITSRKRNPSVKVMIDGVLKRINESLLLSTSSFRQGSDSSEKRVYTDTGSLLVGPSDDPNST